MVVGKRRLKAVYTPALGAKICYWIAKGLQRRAAAAKVGVTMPELAKWLKQSRDGELEQGEDFHEEFEIAEATGQADAEIRLIDMSKSAHTKAAQLKAHEMFMKGRYWEDWGAKNDDTATALGKFAGATITSLIDFVKPAHTHEINAKNERARKVIEGTAESASDSLLLEMNAGN